jgi:hypothetical protein
VSGLISGIKDAAGGIKNALKKPINAVIKAWNKLKIPRMEISVLGKSVGIGPFNLPNLPTLDTGGIVSTPTLALLAANSRPEAVVPLGRGGGVGTTIINVPLSMVGASPNEAARLIWKELLRLKTTGEAPSLGMA